MCFCCDFDNVITSVTTMSSNPIKTHQNHMKLMFVIVYVHVDVDYDPKRVQNPHKMIKNSVKQSKKIKKKSYFKFCVFYTIFDHFVRILHPFWIVVDINMNVNY